MTLLNPEPQLLSGLVPFGIVRSRARDLTRDEWRKYWASNINPLRAQDAPWAEMLDRKSERCLLGEDYADECLQLALEMGALLVLVSNPVHKVGFLVRPLYWWRPEGIRRSIETGIWWAAEALIQGAMLEHDHVGYPLFVKKQSLRDFGRRPIGSATARQIAQAVIKQYQEHNPGSAMRLGDFFTEVRRRDDRMTKSISKPYWTKDAPQEWRKAGSKSRSPSPR